MTEVLKTAASKTARVSAHARNATNALHDFREAGINAGGILMNPPRQLRDLQAARDELDQAIAIIAMTSWPNEVDYHALIHLTGRYPVTTIREQLQASA